MFGNQNTRSRAKKLLQCEKIGSNQWRVSGGQAEHIVTIADSGKITCDCIAAKDKTCSHIVKVWMEINPDAFDPTQAPAYSTVKLRIKRAKLQHMTFKEAFKAAIANKPYSLAIQEKIAEMVVKYLKNISQ